MFMALFYALMTGLLVFVGLLFAGMDGIRSDWFVALMCFAAAYATARLFMSELKGMDDEHRAS
jgi:predicted exporter